MELKETVEEYQKLIQRLLKNNNGPKFIQDARAVRTLMEQGHPDENIKQAVIEFSPIVKSSPYPIDPLGYATHRVSEAHDVIKAIDKIKGFDATTVSKADELSEYQRLAKEHIERGGALNVGMDIDIALKMTQSGHSNENIEKVIQELSPVYTEIGRSPDMYVEDVMEGVKRGLSEEYKRIAELSHLPLEIEDLQYIKKSNDVLTDYRLAAAHILEMDGYCWLGKESDVKIAKELFIKGHEQHKIHQAINQLSPETAGKTPLEMTKYSQEVTRISVKTLSPELKRQNYVRSLGR